MNKYASESCPLVQNPHKNPVSQYDPEYESPVTKQYLPDHIREGNFNYCVLNSGAGLMSTEKKEPSSSGQKKLQMFNSQKKFCQQVWEQPELTPSRFELITLSNVDQHSNRCQETGIFENLHSDFQNISENQMMKNILLNSNIEDNLQRDFKDTQYQSQNTYPAFECPQYFSSNQEVLSQKFKKKIIEKQEEQLKQLSQSQFSQYPTNSYLSTQESEEPESLQNQNQGITPEYKAILLEVNLDDLEYGANPETLCYLLSQAPQEKVKYKSAFKLFKLDKIAQIKTEHPTKDFRERTTIIKDMWQILSQDDKLIYVKKSRLEKLRALKFMLQDQSY